MREGYVKTNRYIASVNHNNNKRKHTRWIRIYQLTYRGDVLKQLKKTLSSEVS